ncbi:MAG: DUF1592 domain-containing protein [Verrucomicrobiota bacterium]
MELIFVQALSRFAGGITTAKENEQGISQSRGVSLSVLLIGERLSMRWLRNYLGLGLKTSADRAYSFGRTMFARRFQIFGWLLCWLWLVPVNTPAAEHRSPGRDIYRKLCTKCHGKDGEGVKEKYDDALSGDWSLEKLTRYIDKNMPENAPEKCVGADAQAVAFYINDAFYSREAGLRNHPPRVELVRLTNRQYVNAVADLIKGFTGGPDSIPNAERGLRATYYNSRNFNSENKFLEQIDRQVLFDFGKESPARENAGTNGFSIQWRGSLIAEESGDYEIQLKTPNGARLWLNDEDEPFIDASVASGELNWQTSTIRLIGGRIYPLRLDFNKTPQDKVGSIALAWKPPHGIAEPIPARNLSPKGIAATFVITTRFPPDDSSVGYERGVAVSKAWDEAATDAAIETANYVAKNLNRLSHSKPDDTNRLAQLEKFCGEFVTTAFRRPLDAEEKNIFVSFQLKNSKNLEDAVKRVVLISLKSPQFLFLGLENNGSSDAGIASRLSFGLWDSLPGSDLVKRAVEGKLREPVQVELAAKQMLEDPRARTKMQYFLQQWLQLNRAEDLSKDIALYPGFSPEIISDLRVSLNIFLEDAVWNGPSDYRTLLRSDALFLNDRLAKFYGVELTETGTNGNFIKVKLDADERSGVLTHPYLLAAFSYRRSTSPIHRGVFLTRNIVGRALKPPPMAQTFNETAFAPHLTMREKVATLTRSESCQTCHSVINPLGFSLENFDAVGKFRTTDNDQPIDAASDYVSDDGQTIRLKGARDVAGFAITSEHAQNGFIEQLFNQVVKQPMGAYGPDVKDRLRQSFVSSDFNLQKLLVDIVTISASQGIEQAPVPYPVARKVFRPAKS